MSRFKFFILLIFGSGSLILADEECGKAQTGACFCIGGDYSEPGQWPWLAALHRGGKYKCGASIISKRHLLGAAHCVHGKGHPKPYPTEDFHALLGAYDLNKNEENSVKIYFSKILIHPDWDADINNLRYDADIAVFSMASEVQFTNLIQPICLPQPYAKIFDIDGTVVGYGLSETSQPHENLPRHVQIKSVDHGTCLYTNYLLARVGSLRMFCAGERGKNPCRGDSGGPFMVRDDDHWSINGIVSASAKSECQENDFVLFTQVPKFLDWIEEIIEKFQPIELNCRQKSSTDVNTCYVTSFEILEENFRVTSINLDESLNSNEIKRIEIENAKVHYLPDFSVAVQKFPNLKDLTINLCKLKHLERSKLEVLPQLTELDLADNELKKLPENIFDDLINLENLWIYFNQIKILPQKLLWKLSKLKKFDAGDNEIEAIPARFFEMNKKIEEILLQNNKIVRIEIDLKEMKKLRELKLDGNRCIDKNFNGENFEEFQNFINQNCH